MCVPIFWLSMACIVYTYIGYPLVLWLCVKSSELKIFKACLEPEISIVISAWNEAANISKRLDNLLAQNYPAEKIEIIVVSDGSSDETTSIVASYQDNHRVILSHHNERLGKAVALNHGIALAKGEIIVFADARQQFAPDAIAELVANFADPQIGCVSGELIFVKDDVSNIQTEMGAYWNYEKWIRSMESRTGSVVGATGAIYALRRALFTPLPPCTILDDVLTPLNAVLQGYRCIFESKAIAVDSFSKDASQEWRRKVRTLAGNWQLMSLRQELLLPVKNPCFWRFTSHKIMRLLVPFALIILFVSGAFLPGIFYRTVTIIQSVLYALALAALVFPTMRTSRLINALYFLLIMNVAAVAGFWQWLTGECNGTWGTTCDIKNSSGNS
jgi:cellulose synthase/poly-beta-1,6-N-acetylglucosamine synthase-like glycosyltransferase